MNVDLSKVSASRLGQLREIYRTAMFDDVAPWWLRYSLDREGRPVWTAKANGWKGFFHLPRVLFRCYQLLDQLTTP